MDRDRTPDETVFLAVFLTSVQARYFTGHILGVDGRFLVAGVVHRYG
jgi:3-oxoacyl-[acyl-carrier protein] reductase